MITFSRSVLADALKAILPAINTRSTRPILANTHIAWTTTQATLTGSNLELTLAQKIPCTADSEGETAVRADKLFAIAKSAAGASIKLDVNNGRVSITSARSRWLIDALPGADYPLTTLDGETREIYLDAAFAYAIRDCITAAAKDDVRYYLNGLLISFSESAACVVGADGHRLAWRGIDFASEAEEEIILPTASAKVIADHLATVDAPIRARLSASKLALIFPGLRIITNVVDGKYPDWRRSIERKQHPTKISAPKSLLEQALTRLLVIATAKAFPSVTLDSSAGALTLSTQTDAEEAQESIDADVESQAKISLHPAYLLDALKIVQKETAVFYVYDDMISIPVSDDERDGQSTIMSMRT